VVQAVQNCNAIVLISNFSRSRNPFASRDTLRRVVIYLSLPSRLFSVVPQNAAR
jgi:hypothetical protein